ncbi:MAG: threonine dehydratase [Burkholderiales bacterium]|nr:threonine dehydratase [Burkholderiales bacterium]
MSDLPSLDQIETAARVVYDVMPATPQHRWPLLCEALNAQVWVKHENHTPIGAFKVRGGLVYFNDIAHATQQPAGVVSATRGNHGQSIALAAARYGMQSIIVVPQGNSVEKNAAMRALGATLIEHGDDFQAAREHAVELAHEHKLAMVPSFHPLLIQGVATYSLELLRAVPDVDVVYVPIGLGSGACALLAAKRALAHPVRVVGVVSRHATTYADSIAAGRVVESPVSTRIADGMAVRRANDEALALLAGGLERLVQVSDDEVAGAMRAFYADTHNLAEGAGAAALAAALQERGRLAGQTVGVALTGANVDARTYADVLLNE